MCANFFCSCINPLPQRLGLNDFRTQRRNATGRGAAKMAALCSNQDGTPRFAPLHPRALDGSLTTVLAGDWLRWAGHPRGVTSVSWCRQFARANL